MALSLRQREFVRRLLGTATNPARVRIRTALQRTQQLRIGDHTITLPPGHNLPYFQRRDPTYDAYASELLRRLATSTATLDVIDLGGNVGDTAVAALTAAPNIRTLSVEGNPAFTSYLRANVAPFGDRATVAEGFVGPVGDRDVYVAGGSTGGFQGIGGGTVITDWVAPQELLRRLDPASLAVWKSDIDGFDIHVLVKHWRDITGRCEVLWFEYDPVGTLGDPEDASRLADLVSDSGRDLLIFDNIGTRMWRARAAASGEALRDVTGWLRQSRRGFAPIPYVDVWLAPATLIDLIDPARSSDEQAAG